MVFFVQDRPGWKSEETSVVSKVGASRVERRGKSRRELATQRRLERAARQEQREEKKGRGGSLLAGACVLRRTMTRQRWWTLRKFGDEVRRDGERN